MFQREGGACRHKVPPMSPLQANPGPPRLWSSETWGGGTSEWGPPPKPRAPGPPAARLQGAKAVMTWLGEPGTDAGSSTEPHWVLLLALMDPVQPAANQQA